MGEDTIGALLGRSGEKTEILCDDERFNGVDFLANCARQTVVLHEGVVRRGLIGVKSEVQLKKVEDAIVIVLMELELIVMSYLCIWLMGFVPSRCSSRY